MEITLFGHEVSLYGNILHFILRVYDSKGYVHFVVSTLKDKKPYIWKENRKDLSGNWLRHL